MRTQRSKFLRIFALVICLTIGLSYSSHAAIINAASCTQAAVTTAYNAAVAGTSTSSPGDTVVIPAGDCDTTNKWTSYLTITKAYITIQGAGGTNTKIGISAGSQGFRVTTNGVRITGINIKCNYANTSNAGPMEWGTGSSNPTWHYTDLRIDNNTFDQCGIAGGASTGREAITAFGWIDGVIDHNTFNDCNSECINWCADAILALSRSLLPGQWGNGTIYIEDNTFNTIAGNSYENIMDGNSGQRSVLRHNTINIVDGARYQSGVGSTHETCAICSSSAPGTDTGSLVTEFYENTINLNTTGTMRDFQICRGGRCLIYSNHITFTGSSSGRYDVGAWFSNYRSTGSYPCNTTMLHNRGLSTYVHEVDGAFTTDGLQANKTTLNGALTAGATTITLTSTTGFNTNGAANGYAIRVDNEVIQWTGVSGNQLTGVTRGVNGSTAASHLTGASVNYLMFGANVTNGLANEMPNNGYVWNNSINGVVSSAMNNVFVYCDSCAFNDYSRMDVASCASRPNNCQYTEGGAGFSYVAYTYPHPLISGVAGDITPPTAPTNLRLVSLAQKTISVTWDASTDDTAVTGYLIEHCSGVSCTSFSQVGTTAALAFTDSSLLVSTSYSLRVRATDAAGNLSTYSSTLTINTPNVPFHPSLNLRRVNDDAFFKGELFHDAIY